MAVLVEAISVIVRRPAIDERFNGGWPAFLQAIPNRTGCLDKHIVRVGFMSPDGVHAFVTMLEHEGLIFIRNREAVDIAIVDQMRGPTVPAPWLTVGKIQLFDSKIKVDACWLTGQAIDGISLPPNWKFDGSMSFTPGGAVMEYCQLSPQAMEHYKKVIDTNVLTTRSMDRLAKVARTVADLAEHDTVEPEHIDSACRFVIGGMLRENF